jgi:hypothetical protein
MNISEEPVEVTIDLSSKSKNMLYLPIDGKVTKVVSPGEIEFFVHAIANPSQESFVKKCVITSRLI